MSYPPPLIIVTLQSAFELQKHPITKISATGTEWMEHVIIRRILSNCFDAKITLFVKTVGFTQKSNLYFKIT